MAKNYAITIGINKYEYILRPLKYAVSDAEKMREFLLNEAGFDRVFYYSDNSPEIDGCSTRPTRSNLERLLEVTFKKPFMQAGDSFWFFFSGHGSRENGVDYLIPTDAFPENLQKSAISVSYIIQKLQRCGADNVVLILDACREQGDSLSKSIKGIGEQTENEARQTGVISICSCSPNEYSWELEELESGVFTYALLEGLGSTAKKATVERLNEYLKYRVQELAHHKGRQTPRIMADPIEKSHLILIPKYANKEDIDQLRNDAYKAQVNQDLDKAKSIWNQVLNTDLDSDIKRDALQALEQIAIEKAGQPKIHIPPSSSLQYGNPGHKLASTKLGIKEFIGKFRSYFQPKTQPEIELKSEVGVDYCQLQELLSQGKWKEADEETARIMRKVANKEERSSLNSDDLKKFPSADLRTIDQLWIKYSNGHFGFSIQKKIYFDCGAKLDGNYPGDQIWDKFCQRVGWRVNEVRKYYSQLTFDTSAPKGHLPVRFRGVERQSWGRLSCADLFSRKDATKVGSLLSRTDL